ncbi:MAG: acetyl-CoA carboxylase biotin carboxyl carrier protein [Luteibaculaceae bacterium]
MNLNEIQDLIKFVSKSGVSEVEIEQKDFKITIKTESAKSKKGANELQQHYLAQPMQMPMGMPMGMQQQQQPAQAPQVAASAPAKPAEENKNYIEIKSPMIGTFYRSPSPDKPAFVQVGDDIKVGDVICIVEAMKLFNEIESEVSGKIVKVLVDDASPVEYDQPLFLVEPA